PRPKNHVLILRRRFLLKKYRSGHAVGRFRKSFPNKAKGINVKILDQRCVCVSGLVNERQEIFLLWKEYDTAKKAFRPWQQSEFYLNDHAERALAADEKIYCIQGLAGKITARVLSHSRPRVGGCSESYRSPGRRGH